MIASDTNHDLSLVDSKEISAALRLVRKMRDRYLNKVTYLHERLAAEEEMLQRYTHEEIELEKLLSNQKN